MFVDGRVQFVSFELIQLDLLSFLTGIIQHAGDNQNGGKQLDDKKALSSSSPRHSIPHHHNQRASLIPSHVFTFHRLDQGTEQLEADPFSSIAAGLGLVWLVLGYILPQVPDLLPTSPLSSTFIILQFEFRSKPRTRAKLLLILHCALMGKGRMVENKFTRQTNSNDVVLQLPIQDSTNRDFSPLLGTSSDRCVLPLIWVTLPRILVQISAKSRKNSFISHIIMDRMGFDQLPLF